MTSSAAVQETPNRFAFFSQIIAFLHAYKPKNSKIMQMQIKLIVRIFLKTKQRFI